MDNVDIDIGVISEKELIYEFLEANIIATVENDSYVGDINLDENFDSEENTNLEENYSLKKKLISNKISIQNKIPI